MTQAELTSLVDHYAVSPDDRNMLLQMLGVKLRCGSCGGKMRNDNKYGTCTRYPQCRRIHNRVQSRVLNQVVSPYKD